MDQLGMNFTADGSTMSRKEVEKHREKKGECVTCGQKLYERKMFQKVPLTINGLVLSGRCLNCRPVSTKNLGANVVIPAAARTATSSDMRKIEQQRQNSSRRSMRLSSRRITSSGNGSSIRASIRNVGNTTSASSRNISNTASASASNRAITATTKATEESKDNKPSSTPAPEKILEETTGGFDSSNNGVYKSAMGTMAAHALAKRMLRRHREEEKEQQEQEESGGGEGGLELTTLSNILTSMQAYANDNNIDYTGILKCFDALNSLLAKDDDKHKNEFIQHEDGYTSILQLIKIISSNDNNNTPSSSSLNNNENNKLRIMEEGIKYIHQISKNNKSSSVIIKNSNDIFESIVSSYQKVLHDSPPDLTSLVLETIGFIASDLSIDKNNDEDDNDNDLLMVMVANQSKTVVPYIIQCMNTYLENVSVQTNACIAITNLSKVTAKSSSLLSESVKESVIKDDGFNAINIAMMMHGSESNFLSHALSTLRHLCYNDHNNAQNVKLLIAESGGIDNAIKAMQDHRDVGDVQEKGCWAISTLATLSTDDVQNYKIFIGDLGGIDVIVRALWVHMDNLPLVQEGLQGLWTLSLEVTNRDRMVEVGAIAVIVSCMRAHQGDDIIQSKSCGIFANISANNDNHRIKIVNEEGLDVIIMAMILHSESKNVQSLGVNALKKLTSESTIGVMRECGVDGILMCAKEKFPDCCGTKADFILNFNKI